MKGQHTGRTRSLDERLPSRSFLIVGATDWILAATGYTAAQQGAAPLHVLLFAFGAAMIVLGMLRDPIVRLARVPDAR